MKLLWSRSILVLVLVVYFNLVMANLVSLRQHWYVQTFRNGTEMEPLYDTMFMDWIGSTGMSAPLALRDMVDVCTWTWVLGTILCWGTLSLNPRLAARALAAQLLFIPMFTLAQLLTIVPDATPHCLSSFAIPSGSDIGWIFWRYPLRSCGNMLWSSDIAQLIVFTSIAVDMVSDRRQCLKRCVWLLGHCWILMTMGFVFSARYQYSVDVISTVIVVKMAITHQSLTKFAEYCFVQGGDYFDRVPMHELMPVTI